eukprot:1151575-Pelagomonas_calceolata.AAC.2
MLRCSGATLALGCMLWIPQAWSSPRVHMRLLLPAYDWPCPQTPCPVEDLALTTSPHLDRPSPNHFSSPRQT